MTRDYRKLLVFQKTDDLTIEIYKVTRTFPKTEIFGITSQLRRAALSVPTNIVEGSQRPNAYSLKPISVTEITSGSIKINHLLIL